MLTSKKFADVKVGERFVEDHDTTDIIFTKRAPAAAEVTEVLGVPDSAMLGTHYTFAGEERVLLNDRNDRQWQSYLLPHGRDTLLHLYRNGLERHGEKDLPYYQGWLAAIAMLCARFGLDDNARDIYIAWLAEPSPLPALKSDPATETDPAPEVSGD